MNKAPTDTSLIARDRQQKMDSLRRRRNNDLVIRIRRGETIAPPPAESTWFPPRPHVKKDREAVSKLYSLKDS